MSVHGVGNLDPSIHSNLLREFNKENVYEKFDILCTLGNGSMGAVQRVRVKPSKLGGSAFQPKKRGFKKFFGAKQSNSDLSEKSGEHIYALKSIILDRVSPLFLEELRNEIRILRSLDHPNIVKAHEVFYTKKQIYLVLEACNGGDLYTRSPYSESDAARVVEDMLSALRYMHDHGCVHRDLKFENIMFEDDSPTAAIKIIDFGLSKKFLGKPSYMTDRVGTMYTMAPQVLQGIYSSQADLWSTGVIAYMLLSASKPFYHKRRRKMIDLIMRGKFEFYAPVWKDISDDAKSFCTALLQVDPKVRLTAAAALEHSFIVSRETLPTEVPSEETLKAVDDCLLNYRQTSELKKLALNVIAHRSTAEEILQLRQAFDAYDTSNDGIITYGEFKEALARLDYGDKELQSIFSSIDVNRNGYIQYTEFLAATIEARGHIEEDRVAEAFDRIDADDTGYISRKNLREVLGKEYTLEKVNKIIEDADTDKDGRISYSEFLRYFRTNTDAMVQTITDQSLVEGGSTLHESEAGYLGLDAKIPGGRYDSNLSEPLKPQL